MKRSNWLLYLAVALVVLSTLVYVIHFAIFRDVHHIFIYLVGDIAFVPIEVLLVTVIIHRLLGQREKRALLNKLNMVIGAFFSEVGTELLRRLLHCFEERQEIAQNLGAAQNWTHAEFKQAMNYARAIKDKPDCLKINLDEPDIKHACCRAITYRRFNFIPRVNITKFNPRFIAPLKIIIGRCFARNIQG